MRNGMVNIIGAGMAGLSAAIALSEQGVSCRLISSQCSERAQSVLAKGGINAALYDTEEHDSVEGHFADTMRGGADLADPNVECKREGNIKYRLKHTTAVVWPNTGES